MLPEHKCMTYRTPDTLTLVSNALPSMSDFTASLMNSVGALMPFIAVAVLGLLTVAGLAIFIREERHTIS